MKSRYTTVILIVLLLGQMALQWVVPIASVSFAKKAAQIELANSSLIGLQHFRFSKQGFAQKRLDEKEFWHLGLLYDIQQLRSQGDSVFVIAKADLHEQTALTQLHFLLQSDDNQGDASPLKALVAQFFSHLYLPTEPFIWPSLVDLEKPIVIFEIENEVHSRWPDALAPPPWKAESIVYHPTG